MRSNVLAAGGAIRRDGVFAGDAVRRCVTTVARPASSTGSGGNDARGCVAVSTKTSELSLGLALLTGNRLLDV